MANVSILEQSRFSQRMSSNVSLITQRTMEGHNEISLIGENFDSGLIGRLRDDEYESRSGSDNFDGASGDDQDAGDDGQPQRKKKKKYHRHTPQQIHELESFFKECPHPDEKQRGDLSKRLGLENKQVKFWFQNRRTQMKMQLERHENMILRQENEKLRAENIMVKEIMSNPSCSSCGGAAIPGQISMEEHQVRIENARLKDELNRICALTNKFLGRSISSLATPMTPNSGLDITAGRNGVGGSSNFNMSLLMGLEMGDGVMGTPPPTLSGIRTPMGMMGNNVQLERTMLVDLAVAAMDELIKMGQQDSLWIKSSDGRMEVLNHEEYARIGSSFIGQKPNGYVTEATRETGMLMINSMSLVETLLDADRWSEMFPSIIAKALTVEVISSGMGGTRNGALQLMFAEIQLPSPLVPVRQLSFLRFCKQHTEGVWVVVDVSVDIGRNAANGNLFLSCRRLPSGCVLQDTPNGYCKVTWVDHCQYDESVVHQLYRPLVSSGIGFGAHRWVAALKRQCEWLASLMSSSLPSEDPTAISQVGKRSMSKLAQRMTDYFWSGVCASSTCKWDIVHINMGNNDMKLMSRKHMDALGEATGIVLSAATSIWLPLSQKRVFDFLRDAQLRGEWDVLSNGESMQEVLHLVKGQEHGNSISIIRSNNASAESNVIYLQDTWTDSTGSIIVYSPINVQSLNMVMNGGDSTYVAILPSGFAILPDGHSNNNGDNESVGGNNGNDGCLLTVGIQMLLNSLSTTKLTMDSVDTINTLISCTIQKIKVALGVA